MSFAPLTNRKKEIRVEVQSAIGSSTYRKDHEPSNHNPTRIHLYKEYIGISWKGDERNPSGAS